MYAIYDQVFNEDNDGRATVMTVALFLITLVFTLFQIWLLERRSPMSADVGTGVTMGTLAPGFRTFLWIALGAIVAGIGLLLASRRGSPHYRRRVALAGRYLLLILLAVIVLFPIYITVVDSLLKPDQVVAKPPILFPFHPQWSSYSTAWTQGHLGLYLMNSFIVTTVIVVGELATSIAAAYAFAFLDFPFKRTLFVLFLATMMVPLEVTFLTNLSTVVSLGWYNTYLGLTVPFLATGFGAFLLRQAFLGLPRDLRDAAKLDAAGHSAVPPASRAPRRPPVARRARDLCLLLSLRPVPVAVDRHQERSPAHRADRSQVPRQQSVEQFQRDLRRNRDRGHPVVRAPHTFREATHTGFDRWSREGMNGRGAQS